jgi:hypothetical protein
MARWKSPSGPRSVIGKPWLRSKRARLASGTEPMKAVARSAPVLSRESAMTSNSCLVKCPSAW